MTIVCAHGEVGEFCEKHDLVVCERYDGDIEAYNGSCRTLVTDQSMSQSEYYYIKDKLMRRGIDLISIDHKDTHEMLEFLGYVASRRKEKYGGRQPFGYQKRNGVVVENGAMMYVARRIIELRDSGMTLREIQEFPEIHHADGRKISVSTIQQIIKNRERYGK